MIIGGLEILIFDGWNAIFTHGFGGSRGEVHHQARMHIHARIAKIHGPIRLSSYTPSFWAEERGLCDSVAMLSRWCASSSEV